MSEKENIPEVKEESIVPVVSLQNSLNILIEATELGAKSGCYSIDDAANIFGAKTVLQTYIKSLNTE